MIESNKHFWWKETHLKIFKGLDSSICCIVVKLYIWLREIFKICKGTDFLDFINFRICVHYARAGMKFIFVH